MIKKMFFDKVEIIKRGHQNWTYVVEFQSCVQVNVLEAHFHLKKD